MSDSIELRSRKIAKTSESTEIKNNNSIEHENDQSNKNIERPSEPLKKSHRKTFTLINEKNESFHKVRDSLLSSASGYTNYRGFLNLCIVLLVMSTGRLVIENILKYGFLVRFDIPILFIKDPTAWPSLLAFVCTNIFINFALTIERKLEKGLIKEKYGIILGFTNIFMALLLPAIYLWYRKANPISSFFALTTYCCVSMKLTSYLHVNKAYRDKRRKEKEGKKETESLSENSSETSDLLSESTDFASNIELVQYPDNLNAKDIYYFMFAPTLCYEINFPRTPRIRKSFIIKRALEIAFLTTLQFILLQQWVVPILTNSKIPFRESNTWKIIERLLKLAIPNHVNWLIMFYCLFHSYLNVLAEILRFGDREFYRDWWNCENVSEFWKNWNIPVHNFCLRHIYKPLLTLGVSKFQASLIVFFVSAFLHEYLVSIPLRMFRLWSFWGMIMQIPFEIIVRKFFHGNYGNMAVWISLIIGQPIAIMMYIHDYYIDYFRNTV